MVRKFRRLMFSPHDEFILPQRVKNVVFLEFLNELLYERLLLYLEFGVKDRDIRH